MAVPFPGGWDPSTDGFGPLIEGGKPSAATLRRQRRAQRRGGSTTLFILKWGFAAALVDVILLVLAKITLITWEWLNLPY